MFMGEELLQVLMETMYVYNSREERERLDELRQRLSEARLLSHTSIQGLLEHFHELYESISIGE